MKAEALDRKYENTKILIRKFFWIYSDFQARETLSLTANTCSKSTIKALEQLPWK